MPNRNTLLVVDDNAVNRSILGKILSDYTVLTAENGRDALNILDKEFEHVALILLDLVMPVMDGYAFMKALRSHPLYSPIPVIVTTALSGEAEEIRCLDSGASDFVTKPYHASVVRHRVASIIRLREKSAMLNKFENDELTGLLSREFFYLYADADLARHPEKSYDVLCTDVANFKFVNELHGSAQGDRLLIYIADTIRALVGDRGLCGRLNADKFAVLIPHGERRIVTSEATLEEFYQGSPVRPVEFKIGVYENADRSLPISTMCDRAGMAIHTIKRRYGHNIAIYDDTLRRAVMREHTLQDSMKLALAEKQFVVYLQPKHRVKDGSIAGAEALVRWVHPELGFVSPSEFIPLFEQNGFITRLDAFVWEESCRVLKDWRVSGRTLIPISVNVSRIDLIQPNLCDELSALADRYGVPPAMLHLEVTESAYTNNPQQIIGTVAALRSHGFKIEMDDFGSGYSSLNMLSELPIDVLKLDMAFVQRERTLGADKRSILRFILSLSKWLSLPTVAEGVETQEEVEKLRRLGCDFIQGFVYAKPMSIADFNVYLDDHRVHDEGSEASGQRKVSDEQAAVAIFSESDALCETIVNTLNDVCQVTYAESGLKALDHMHAQMHKRNVRVLELVPRE